MPKPVFYIPQWRMWNWRLLSSNFLDYQYKRCVDSYKETDGAMAVLDEDVSKIEQEIRGVWASANVQMMQAFEARLKEIRAERKRVAYCQLKLREAIDAMNNHRSVTKPNERMVQRLPVSRRPVR